MFNHGLMLVLASLLIAAPAAAQAPKPTLELSPAQLESIRQTEIVRAAQLYTGIAFSEQNREKLKSQLPLAPEPLARAMADLKGRFEACMEGALEARLANAYLAQVLRKTMQSALSKKVPEPKDAKAALPAFNAANGFCSARIQAWLAAGVQ